MDCDYVWSGHSQAALRAGVRPEAIDIVAHRGSLDGLTKEEAVIVRFGREVIGDHKLSQEAFDAAVHQFGEANTIVLGALMGHYTMMSCTLIATDYQPAEGAPVLPKLA
jgi:alkylhydroperoxidase family enzyme